MAPTTGYMSLQQLCFPTIDIISYHLAQLGYGIPDAMHYEIPNCNKLFCLATGGRVTSMTFA